MNIEYTNRQHPVLGCTLYVLKVRACTYCAGRTYVVNIFRAVLGHVRGRPDQLSACEREPPRALSDIRVRIRACVERSSVRTDRPSVRLLVRPSIRPSVCSSVRRSVVRPAARLATLLSVHPSCCPSGRRRKHTARRLRITRRTDRRRRGACGGRQ